jgi:hypothetical protein
LAFEPHVLGFTSGNLGNSLQLSIIVVHCCCPLLPFSADFT